jgi:radical SAM superfamily enzyme YgiQ (UPF0313 family)
MKILFVYTHINVDHTLAYPYGLASIMAYARRLGHDIELAYLTDLDAGRAAAVEQAKRFRPDMVAYSSVSSQFSYVQAVARALRAVCDAPHVCGGVHVSLCQDEFLGDAPFDAIVIGEGEEPMAELLACMEKGEAHTGIRNMWVKLPDGTVVRNGQRPFMRDLDALPFPERIGFDYQRIIDADYESARFLFSRGCPFKCTYCSNDSLSRLGSGKYFRLRSVENALAELDAVLTHYQVKNVLFDDDILPLDKEWFHEFIGEYSRWIGMPFACNVRPAICGAEEFAMMKKAGCFVVGMGVESGDDTYRNTVLKRSFTREKLVSSIHEAREAGLNVKSYNLIRLPGETPRMFLETMRVNALAETSWRSLNTFYPYKNTVLGDYAYSEGLVLGEQENVRERRESILDDGDFPNAIFDHLSSRFSPTVDLMIQQKSWNEIDRENERDDLAEYVEQARALKDKRNRAHDLMTDAVLEAVPVGGKVVILGDDVLVDDAADLCAKLKAEVLATATELPADGSAPACVAENPGAVVLVAELAGQGGFGAALAGQGIGFTDVLRTLRNAPAGPGEVNPDVTAVICRTDEETFEDCLASLKRQTMRPGRIEVVDNVTPMHRAFNRMLERATTRYYLHVDADMVLAPDCVETLYDAMRKNEDCFLARAYLKDDLLGRIPFVKLFDRERVGDARYRDTIGCDRDFEGRIMGQGYAAVIVERVLGRHISGRSARAVFLKYKRSMEKCRGLNDPVEVYTKPFFENAVKRRPAMALYALAGFFSGMHSAGNEFRGERDGERADKWLEAARACLDHTRTGKSLFAEQAHYFRGIGMHHMAVAAYAAALEAGAVTVEDVRSYLAQLDAETPELAPRLTEALANHPAEAEAR